MRRINKISLIILCLLCFSLSASEQPLTIPQLLDIAFKNNPQTKSVWWNAQRQAAAEGIAKSAYYPEVSLYGKAAHGYDYKYFNSNETVYTDFEAGLSLSYLLFDFGARDADCQAAVAALMAADWQYNWAMQKVIFEVLNSLYLYYSAQEILEARIASLEDLKSTFESVEELFRHGLRSISDMHTIKATTAEAEMELILQKSAVAIALDNLNLSLSLPINSQLLLAPLEDPPIDLRPYGDIAALVREAECQRADLQAKYAQLNEKEAVLNKEKASYYPKLSFDGNVGVQHYLRDRGQGQDYNVALSFKLPLYNGGKADARKRVALADIEAANFDIDQQRLAIAKEISVYNKQFEASQALFEVVKRYMLNAEQTFEGALERYKAGTISIFDLTAAQRLFAQARIKRAEAKSSWYRDFAGLSFSMGVILKRGNLCASF